MKNLVRNFLVVAVLASSLIACEKEDEGEEMEIHFKSGASYISTNQTLAPGTTFTVGIEAETEEKKDPIIKFNISESVNGSNAFSVYSEDLESTEYEHDQTFVLDSVSGSTHTYTFTITNRDGLNEQANLVIQVQ